MRRNGGRDTKSAAGGEAEPGNIATTGGTFVNIRGDFSVAHGVDVAARKVAI